MRVLKPDTEGDVANAIREAAHASTPFAIEGNGSKRGLGRPVAAETVLKLSGLTGIAMYEPDELVFTARAGTTLEEIEAVLAARGQCLGFEPGDCGPLWGAAKGKATIGGIVAAAIGGPRRFAAGAARDHLLGFTAINGKGERFKAGGRVVKNVTGYDLPKLAAGSFGMLFVMTELTLRAIPKGAASVVLAIEDLAPTEGLRVLRSIAGSPFEPTGLAYRPGSPTLTLIRLDGQADGVKARQDELRRTLAAGARALEPEHGAQMFRALADVHTMFGPDASIWRVSVPSTRAPDAVAKLAPANWFADCAGGVLWLEFAQANAEHVHRTALELGGHATCYRAPDALRDGYVFPPRDAATMALTLQLKKAFDPGRILNPGRMYRDA